MKLKLRVNESHINRGNSSCMNCPIGLAFNDIGFYAWVDVDSVNRFFIIKTNPSTGETKTYKCVEVPEIIKRFVHNFDHQGKNSVKPFDVELEFVERK